MCRIKEKGKPETAYESYKKNQRPIEYRNRIGNSNCSRTSVISHRI